MAMAAPGLLAPCAAAAAAEVAAVKCDDDKPGTRVKSLSGSGVPK